MLVIEQHLDQERVFGLPDTMDSCLQGCDMMLENYRNITMGKLLDVLLDGWYPQGALDSM